MRKTTPLMAAAVKEAKRRRSILVEPPAEDPTRRRATKPSKVTTSRRSSCVANVTCDEADPEMVKKWKAAADELENLKRKEEEKKPERLRKDRERRQRRRLSQAASRAPSPAEDVSAADDPQMVVTVSVSSDEEPDEVKSETSEDEEQFEITPTTTKFRTTTPAAAVTAATTTPTPTPTSTTVRPTVDEDRQTEVDVQETAESSVNVVRATPSSALSRDEVWMLYHGVVRALESEKQVALKERALSLKLHEDLRRTEAEHVRIERALYAEQFCREEAALAAERQRSAGLQAELDRERAARYEWRSQPSASGSSTYGNVVHEPYIPAYVGTGAAAYGDAVRQAVGPHIISDVTVVPPTEGLGSAAASASTAADSNFPRMGGGSNMPPGMPEL